MGRAMRVALEDVANGTIRAQAELDAALKAATMTQDYLMVSIICEALRRIQEVKTVLNTRHEIDFNRLRPNPII